MQITQHNNYNLKNIKTMELPFAESWRIKMVEPIRKSTREEREQWMREAHYNLFQLRSEQVYIDCLTDSGTGAMSDRQWAAVMMGDESYAGSSSFFHLKDTITRLTGFEYVIPTHQGRAAENVLFSHLVKEGDFVPGNSHFDTTKGHIESRKATAVDCTLDEAKNTQLELPFKGNVDPKKLEEALEKYNDKIPFIIITITNKGYIKWVGVCIFNVFFHKVCFSLVVIISALNTFKKTFFVKNQVTCHNSINIFNSIAKCNLNDFSNST